MMLYTQLQAPSAVPLPTGRDPLIDDLSAAALALCTLARIAAPQQALTVLSRLEKEIQDDHTFENFMRTGAYPLAAQWILERSEGPAKVGAQLTVRINRTLQALRLEAIEADASEYNDTSRRLERAFEELKHNWLKRHARTRRFA